MLGQPRRILALAGCTAAEQTKDGCQSLSIGRREVSHTTLLPRLAVPPLRIYPTVSCAACRSRPFRLLLLAQPVRDDLPRQGGHRSIVVPCRALQCDAVIGWQSDRENGGQRLCSSHVRRCNTYRITIATKYLRGRRSAASVPRRAVTATLFRPSGRVLRVEGGRGRQRAKSFRWSDETVIRTFTIMTTTPNAKMSELHGRMPVILDQQDWPTWLGKPRATARQCCVPLPTGCFACGWLIVALVRRETTGLSCWRPSPRSVDYALSAANLLMRYDYNVAGLRKRLFAGVAMLGRRTGGADFVLVPG